LSVADRPTYRVSVKSPLTISGITAGENRQAFEQTSKQSK
jgi:hypothetical protein